MRNLVSVIFSAGKENIKVGWHLIMGSLSQLNDHSGFVSHKSSWHRISYSGHLVYLNNFEIMHVCRHVYVKLSVSEITHLRLKKKNGWNSKWMNQCSYPKQLLGLVEGCSGEGNGNPLQYSCLENPMGGGAWKAAVHGVAKSRTRLSDFTFTFHFYALEKEMATHSSVLAWRTPGTREPGGLPSMGSHRVGHDWSDLAAAAAAVAEGCSNRQVSDSLSYKQNNIYVIKLKTVLNTHNGRNT